MNEITETLKKQSQQLLDRLEVVAREKRKADSEAAKIRAELRALVQDVELPRLTKSSVYLSLDSGKSLIFTTPSKTDGIDPEVFLSQVGEEIFHEVCKITEIDFDMDKWRELREQEIVFDSQLTASIKEDDGREPTVRVSFRDTEKLVDE